MILKLCDSDAKMIIDNNDFAFSHFALIYIDIYRFVSDLVQFDK